MQPADIATLINLRMTLLVGVWESLPLMSLPPHLVSAESRCQRRSEEANRRSRWGETLAAEAHGGSRTTLAQRCSWPDKLC